MRDTGFTYVRHRLFDASRCREAIDDARAFFALPPEVKRSVAIERSRHFRGYSEMKNERDWREQIHFGRERSDARGLDGPNLWPGDVAWRDRMLRLIDDLEIVGREVLRDLFAEAAVSDDAYVLLKLIHYHAAPAGIERSGVAPHVDFSWITLVLQDETGGLQMQTPGGDWVDVPYVPGTLVMNVGEVLAFASRGRYRATPHRVVSSPARSRVSLPFFFNPGLSDVIHGRSVVEQDCGEHVHRVLTNGARESFVFGEIEWRRKGLGMWCASCVGPAAG